MSRFRSGTQYSDFLCKYEIKISDFGYKFYKELFLSWTEFRKIRLFILILFGLFHFLYHNKDFINRPTNLP